METKKKSYVFDRKLTDAEVHELVENYEYTPDFEDDGILWDRFGNPTESMIRWKYEVNHGLDEVSEPMTLEEFGDWLDEVYAEAEAEMAEDGAARISRKISA